MGILGLTHNSSGEIVERLPVEIKVAIGEGPDPKDPHSHPRRLDHFVFKRRKVSGNGDRTEVAWESAQDITEIYGEPNDVGIIFMDDDPANLFRTELAWWGATEVRCRGQLVQIENEFKMRATRKTEKHPEGEEWPGNYKYSSGENKGKSVEPCGDGCPDLEAGRCKPSGDLYFILDKFPMIGAICRLHTTSYRSIRNIANGIEQIRKITGGRLVGIRAMLKARPEKITYDGSDGKKHSSVAHILSVVIDATDMKQLIANMTETAQLFESSRKLLGAAKVEYIEHEDRPRELAAEFYEAPNGAIELEPESLLAKANGNGHAEEQPQVSAAPAETFELKPPEGRIPASSEVIFFHVGKLIVTLTGATPRLSLPQYKELGGRRDEARRGWTIPYGLLEAFLKLCESKKIPVSEIDDNGQPMAAPFMAQDDDLPNMFSGQ